MKTETKTEVATETMVAHEDLDDVIELAARMMQEEEGALTDEEVKEVALELDIPEAYIDRARAQLERVKAEKEAETKRLAAAKKRKIIIGSAVVVFAVAVVGVNNSSVGSLHARVAAQEAQVDNVTERQREVTQMLQSRPNSPDKDAELLGAQNRVRVETKRYNEVAAKYNARTEGAFTTFTLLFSSLPSSVSMKK